MEVCLREWLARVRVWCAGPANFASMLEAIFTGLLKKHSPDEQLAATLWEEIEIKYSGKNRYYHNLHHLENLLQELTAVKHLISDWNTILFTLFYHDAIYNILKSDNEEKSAALAAKRMKEAGVPQEMINLCKEQILATKSHAVSINADTNSFTDADLSVLGQSWEVYSAYFKNIRKEYTFYPDMIYKPGRKKVIQHFLMMERIYKTDHFYRKYEAQARLNLEKEFLLLQNL